MKAAKSVVAAGLSSAANVLRHGIAGEYLKIRHTTEALAQPLTAEDQVIQSMPDASPTKWHLAHTTWFFETFILLSNASDYRRFDPKYQYLFNSYYNSIGERHCRARRGMLSRPRLEEVRAYRQHVDEYMLRLLEATEPEQNGLLPVLLLGLNHEQQHQELIVTDIKHVFWSNPLRPAYCEVIERAPEGGQSTPMEWRSYGEGVRWIGHDGNGFAFDNECPRHRVFLEPYRIASRVVTNGEYLAFMQADGYRRPELWLSEGWDAVLSNAWNAPLYWEQKDGEWWAMTCSGMRRVNAEEPVCHVSYYEADAFARWADARLPTEAEWEVAAGEQEIAGNFLESGKFHPATAPAEPAGESLAQIFGDVWEWTGSAYLAYPGYHPVEGALGEYNGKFMCNQMVLRGGSCATPRSHIRPSYRNFFAPQARWQFSGIRLANDH